MPAKERSVVVQYKWTYAGGGRKNDCDWASHNRQTGHSKGFGDDDKTAQDRDVTN